MKAESFLYSLIAHHIYYLTFCAFPCDSPASVAGRVGEKLSSSWTSVFEDAKLFSAPWMRPWKLQTICRRVLCKRRTRNNVNTLQKLPRSWKALLSFFRTPSPLSYTSPKRILHFRWKVPSFLLLKHRQKDGKRACEHRLPSEWK